MAMRVSFLLLFFFSLLLVPVQYLVAVHYGEYLSASGIKSLEVGALLDVLCSDGLNYHVQVKQNDNGVGLLHFRHWSKK